MSFVLRGGAPNKPLTRYRKIIELVRETGQVNGRLATIALDLTTERASRILGDLVERQILVKTSEAQRGPSVTYGPGPQFPGGAAGRARRRPHGVS